MRNKHKFSLRLSAILLCLLMLTGCTKEQETIAQGLTEIAMSAVLEDSDMSDMESEEANTIEAVPMASETEKPSGEFLNDPAGAGVYLDEEGTYTSADDVALYLYLYDELPDNFITKKEAQELGWEGGSLEPYAPGMCIGGDYFGNYEGTLPTEEGRNYHECDIDTLGASSRGAKRIVYSNDGLIYYTADHYETYTLLYGDE